MKFVIIIITIAFAICGCNHENNKISMNEEAILVVAKQHVRERYPSSESIANYEPVILDKGDFWEVTFKLPELTLGGVPVVKVSKETGKVIDSYHTQ